MVLTARTLIGYVTHAMGGDLDSRTPALEVVNQAAEILESSRKWSYLLRSTRDLNVRAPNSSSVASFTGSTQTLAATELGTYNFVPGDTCTSYLSTGALIGTYHVVSSDTATTSVILDASAITSATPIAPISYTMNQSRIRMPSDFGRMVSLHGSFSGAIREVYPASLSGILDEESYLIPRSSFYLGYRVEWNSGAAKEAPVATLRLTPEPTAQAYSALGAVYYRVWPTMTSDADVAPIPPYMEPLLIQFCRALAQGYDGGVANPEAVSVAINSVQAGPVYRNAATVDAAVQLEGGPARNRGIAQRSEENSISDILARSQTSGIGF